MKHFRLLPLQELADILFPRHCFHCGQLLVGDERFLCTHCWLHLPYTYNAPVADNETEQHFQSHREVAAAMSLLQFFPDSASRDILHQIKYHGACKLALSMGKMMGEQLVGSGRFASVEMLVPVPLHPRRERHRGYNQSELLCRGIAQVMQRPVSTGNLVRTVNTESQTHKTAEERLENVKGVFVVRKPEKYRNKHILLVDDVITTGSTTAACCDALWEAGVTRISIASLALASS